MITSEQVSLGGVPRVGFGAAPPSPWRAQANAKLAELDRLIAAGRGNELVRGGGCTEPGGGIVPTTRTVNETAAMIRSQINLGLGQLESIAAPVASGASPWTVMLATSVVSAATGWVIEEVARTVRNRKKRR